MYDVITVGSATIDQFLSTKVSFKDINLGDKRLVDSFDEDIGGGGVNSGIALSRLGLKTAYLGKIGDDGHGRKIVSELKKESVSLFRVKRSRRYHTSLSTIICSPKDKDRVILTYKGAADHLQDKDFDIKKISCRWIYLATLMEESFDTAKRIVRYAHSKGIKILFNPSLYLAEKGVHYLDDILRYTHTIVLNRSEAEALLNTEGSAASLSRKLHSLGPQIVIITEGKKGVNAFDGGCFYWLKAYDVSVINTTGAGDAFTSGFLAGMIKKEDIRHSLEIGMANASSVIQKLGARNGLLTYRKALSFVKEHKEPVTKVVCRC